MPSGDIGSVWMNTRFGAQSKTRLLLSIGLHTVTAASASKTADDAERRRMRSWQQQLYRLYRLVHFADPCPSRRERYQLRLYRLHTSQLISALQRRFCTARTRRCITGNNTQPTTRRQELTKRQWVFYGCIHSYGEAKLLRRVLTLFSWLF